MIRPAALIAAGLLLLSACGGSESELGGNGDVGAGGSEGETLPAIEITELSSGASAQLDEIEGPAVVNLWATWCAPCRAEIPDFEEVHQARGDEVRFVGINVGEDSGRAAEFIDEVGATYDQFLDEVGEVSTELKATSMPVTVVIDADGVVTTRHLGPLDQDGLNEAIDETLGSG